VTATSCHSALRQGRPRIRVAIVSDLRVHRDGLATILDSEHDIDVVAAVENSRQSLTSVLDVKPDVVLLDVTSPAEWAAAARALNGGTSTTRLIALAVPSLEGNGFASGDVVAILAEAGVAAYLNRNAGHENVLNAVRAVKAGNPALSAPALTPMALPASLGLTRRETEIFLLLQEGLSNKEIATRLSISLATVKNHVHNIFRKLGLTRRYDTVRVAAAGVTPDD
jgi:DNA-binding NarL/FixJ family response regulator